MYSMIYRQGEFIRLVGSIVPPELEGRVGQIDKVKDLDKMDYPYRVVSVLPTGQTIKLMVSKDNLQLLTYRDAELEIGQYLDKVLR